MPMRVVADLEPFITQRFHLPIGHIPVFARLERIEVADVDRAAKAHRLQNWAHICRMAGRAIVKSDHHQFIGNRLSQDASRLVNACRLRTLNQHAQDKCNCQNSSLHNFLFHQASRNSDRD